MMLFRQDTVADSGHNSGITSKKAHPIFKGTKSIGGNITEDDSGLIRWSIFNCNINLDDCDVEVRRLICVILIAVITASIGIAMMFCPFQEFQISGKICIALSGAALIIAIIWLIISRRKNIRAFKAKAKDLEHESLDSVNNATHGSFHIDPYMIRGIVTINYQSCEDTMPYGSGMTPAGKKAVRIAPSEGFSSVESSCFQIVNPLKGTKYNNLKHQARDTKASESQSAAMGHRTGTGRSLPERPRTHGSLRDASNSKDLRYQPRDSSDRNKKGKAMQHQIPEPTRSHSTNFELVNLYHEQQPMLEHHDSVYQTDVISNKRAR